MQRDNLQAGSGPDPHPRRPAFRAPAGTVDCHAHVFGPRSRYPYAPERSYTPVESPLEQYVAMLDALGIDRAVLVQGSPQGTDNRIVLDAIASAPQRFRGIAVVAAAISDRELEALDRGGIRGIRMSDTMVPGTPLALMETFADRVRPLGWHLQLHLGGCDDLIPLAPRIERLKVPIVVDHMASVTADDGPDAAGFARLGALMRDFDHVWAKVAAFYRRSRLGPPYADMREMARVLARTRGERVIWGTNWPHPVGNGVSPNDGDLLDLVADWFPEEQLQRHILVENPQQLFGFPPVPDGTEA